MRAMFQIIAIFVAVHQFKYPYYIPKLNIDEHDIIGYPSNKLSAPGTNEPYTHKSSGITLQWRHNERDGVSNHQPHDCLLNSLFKAQIKENIKVPRHCPFMGNIPVTSEFLAQGASNAENVSIWWRHHDSEYYGNHS